MAALTQDRNTHMRDGELFSFPACAGAKIYAGGIVMLNANGYAVPGAVATGQICVGRAEDRVDNTAGGNGALNVPVRAGVFKFAGPDITIAHVGDQCYLADDQTVSISDGTGARSAAGKVVGVEDDGVWVRMGL